MKMIYYFFMLSIVFVVGGCGNWLDVQPTTEKDREDLIETEDGFKQMLYGTYINLVHPDLYGHQLTYGLLEGLARNYVWHPTSSYNYEDKTVRPTIDAIWNTMYNNIANVNSILKDIKSRKDLFINHEGDVLEAEALAMRAFMHFDLLRMFAPAYQDNEDRIAIPYVETYERVRYPHLPTKEIMEKVLKDLNEAEKMLEASDDPILKEVICTYSGKNDFMANRQYRFNYWAVSALKARVYLYMGDTENANHYAMKVIEESPFTWVSETDVTSGDRIFMPELICGLNVPKLANYYETYFTSEKYSLSDGWGVYGLGVFEDANDFRYLYLLSNDRANNKVISSKYNQRVSSSGVMKKETVPLIRLGEMYLIAAECNIEDNPSESIRLLRELKSHRGYLSEDKGIVGDASAILLFDYIKKEMRKETYAEGQMFFFWKRLKSSTTPGFSPWSSAATTPMKVEYYTFPLPESELEYGNIPSNGELNL